MTICNMSIEAGARAGHGRARRHDVRLRRGPAARAARRGRGSARSRTGARCRPTTARRSTRRSTLDAAELRPYVTLGDEPRADRHDRRAPCPTRGDRRRRQARGGRPRARVHGARARHADPRDPPRHDLHRLVHELADRGSARRGRGRRRPHGRRRSARARRSRLVRGEGSRRSARVSTGSSPRPGSSGAAPDARCAWA